VRIENLQDDSWTAWDGTSQVGAMSVWRSPDGRCRLYFNGCQADAYGPLSAAIDGQCYAYVPLSDEAAQAALREAGFAGSRVEHNYRVPVRSIDAPVPPGIRFCTVDEAAAEQVMLLDCAIRQDIPGSDGWQPDMEFFRQQTYDEPRDPSAYLIAADGAAYVGAAHVGAAAYVGAAYVGLVRVWLPEREGAARRLGCIGVLPGYRKRGLARALVGAVFAVLTAQGVAEVTCEIDDANTASKALFTSLGAVAEGGTIELMRPRD
jgi:ribosomal protein S18 acetylase RimI-like enzyme